MNDLHKRNQETLARIEAKMNEPPEDYRDSPDYEDMRNQLWDEKIMDINGYFIESITEQNDDVLNRLARMVRDNENGTHNSAIGALVTKWVVRYCEPKDGEVEERFELDGDY